MVRHIQKNHANKKIGLIGTKQTVRSNVYKKRFDQLDQNIELAALATPLLVPLIEEGFADKQFSEIIIKEYLSHPNLLKLDALILGCTHYPLLKTYIQNYYQNEVDIIDASEMTAKILHEHLKLHKLSNPSNNPKKTFYVSDYSDFFANTAKIFFPGDIRLEAYPLWD